MISKHTKTVLKTLSRLIQVARQERAFSQAELAERLNVTRQTVIAIEKGDRTVSIGTVFEAAHLLGIPLFSEEDQQLSKWQTVLTGFSALLPKRTHHKKPKVSDDF